MLGSTLLLRSAQPRQRFVPVISRAARVRVCVPRRSINQLHLRLMSVRTRFAPSPTGSLHIGGLRTALFNYLYAKRMGGSFILRIEDTDKVREVPGSIDDIKGMLEWCRIVPDEGPGIESNGVDHGPYTQSERLQLYHEHCNRLVESGAAYPCFCSKERLAALKEESKDSRSVTGYDGHCSNIDPAEAQRRCEAGEPHTVRMRVPRPLDTEEKSGSSLRSLLCRSTETRPQGSWNPFASLCSEGKTLSFEDELRGTIQVDLDRIDDQVIMKSDGFPTYHLASVVDDHLMGITHVIRGQEWLLSTPKHVLLYDALGWPRPKFLHLPLLLNEDRSKMSKRKGDVSVCSFKNRGFTGDAMVNFVALLGWTPESSAAFAGCNKLTSGDRKGKNNKRKGTDANSKNQNQEDELSFSDLFTLDQLVREFDISRLSSSPSVVSLEKLRWMNRWHIQQMNCCPEKRPQLLSELRRSFLPTCDHPNATVAGILAAMSKFNELDRDKNGFLEGAELLELAEWASGGVLGPRGTERSKSQVDRNILCEDLRNMLTERLLPCINSSTEGRLSFDEFETWFLDTRAGLLRLMDVATAEATDPIPSNQGRSRSFVCRQDPNWPSDEYLSAAVSHLGKRLVSLADFPEVGEYLFRAPCFKPGGAGGVVAASMLAREGGDAAAVAGRLALLRESFEAEVGEEGSGAFESPETVQDFVKRFAAKAGLKPKQLMFPTRVALTGSAQGGPFYEMIFLLGRRETLARLKAFEVHINEFAFDHEVPHTEETHCGE